MAGVCGGAVVLATDGGNFFGDVGRCCRGSVIVVAAAGRSVAQLVGCLVS